MWTRDAAIVPTLLLGVIVLHESSQTRQWPPAAPLNQEFVFEDADHAKLTLQLSSPDNKPLYLLYCEGAGVKTKINTESEFTGDFECRLSSLYSTERWSTLLSEKQHTKVWESRGRFLADELYGKCADYPEYGRVRTFRLRGMRIRFELSNMVFARGRRRGDTWDGILLSSFHFRITVQPDQTAQSPIAESISYKYPPELYPGKDGSPLDCRTVRRILMKR